MPLKIIEKSTKTIKDLKPGDLFRYEPSSGYTFLRTDAFLKHTGWAVRITDGSTCGPANNDQAVTLLPKGTLLEVV